MAEVTPSTATGKTTQTFLTALITNSALLGIELCAFVLLKNRLSRIYSPRTYLPPPDKRAEVLPNGPWRWLPAVIVTPPEDIIRKNGLDAYMFLRFLRLMIVIFTTFTFVTWLVILPVDTVNVSASQSDGLTRLSWGNIPIADSDRYAAHIIVVYLLTFWVLHLIRREHIHYAHMRQAYLVSRSHARTPRARTVLITNVPPDMCSEKEIRLWASFVPGGVQNVWVYRDTRELNKAYDARLEACTKLEGAVAQLLRRAVREMARRQRRGERGVMVPRPSDIDVESGSALHSRPHPPAHTSRPHSPVHTSRPHSPAHTSRPHSPAHTPHPSSPTHIPLPPSPSPPHSYPPSSPKHLSPPHTPIPTPTPTPHTPSPLALLHALVPPPNRPHHRLGPLGLLGHKVDTVEYCTAEIARLNARIAALRGEVGEARPLGCAFVQCRVQMGAHVLGQCVAYHEPMMMADKWVQVAPKDVIWANIDDGIYETRLRYVTSWLASLALIALWFFPVSFVGLLSNVSELCTRVRWLAWVCTAPAPVPGIIQGILPPLILAILFAVLPWVLRGLAWYENIPLYSLLSISVYKRYYLFLVVHGFLVVTLSSGITATASELISSPTKAVSELASHLPDASVFFLTWTVTQGLTGAGSALLQVVTLLMYFIKKWFFGRTPRQAYAVTFLMPSADFGTVLPQMSLLATIGLAYSVLAPVINALAAMAFVLFYFTWKFLLTWVFDQMDEQETGGLYFPIAMHNLFVGLYIEQICLAALFFLKSSAEGRHAFLAQGILMLVLLVITLSAQIFLQRAFAPLTRFLPMSLATQKMQERVAKRRGGADRQEGREEDEFDLFDRQRFRSVVRRHIARPAQHLARRLDPGTAPLPLSMPTSPMPTSPMPTADPSSDSDSEADFDENGFEHPSTYAAQPWVWVPRDAAGMGDALVRALREAGVDASDEGARMDGEGVVEVGRNPPDEAWMGGCNA